VRKASSPTARRGDEDGQITAMLVILGICLLLAIIAVIDISGSYLRRQAAMSLADGAALSASDAAAAAGVYGNAQDSFVVIDEGAATAAVDSYLRGTGAFVRYPGLRVQVRVVGHTVTVDLSMPYALPVTLPGVASSATIHGSGAAEMPIY
jgi:hypothetical protein